MKYVLRLALAASVAAILALAACGGDEITLGSVRLVFSLEGARR